MTRYVARFTFNYNGYFFIDIDAWSDKGAELIGQQIAENLRAEFVGIK